MSAADSNATTWSDEAIAAGITRILNVGVIISVLLVLFGGVIFLFHHGLETFSDGIIPNENLALSDPRVVICGVLAGKGRAIIQLGLIVLIATPIARVAFSVFAFAKQKDRAYTIIT